MLIRLRCVFSLQPLAAPNIREEDIREGGKNTIYCEEVEQFVQTRVALSPSVANRNNDDTTVGIIAKILSVHVFRGDWGGPLVSACWVFHRHVYLRTLVSNDPSLSIHLNSTGGVLILT